MSEFDINPAEGGHLHMAELGSTEELVTALYQSASAARATIVSRAVENLRGPWTMLVAGESRFTLAKGVILRTSIMDHIVHHPAQRGVYLRLLGVPVPQLFGPTADFPEATVYARRLGGGTHGDGASRVRGLGCLARRLDHRCGLRRSRAPGPGGAVLQPQGGAGTGTDVHGRSLGFDPTPPECSAFAASVGDYPAFPNTVDTLRRLGTRFRLGIFTIRASGIHRGWNGIHYKTDLSAKNVPARELSMNVARIPLGVVALLHTHVDYEVMLDILQGTVRYESGRNLRHSFVNHAGDCAPRRRKEGCKPSAQLCCARDAGSPLAAAVQAEAVNCLLLPRLRGVSEQQMGEAQTLPGIDRGAERK